MKFHHYYTILEYSPSSFVKHPHNIHAISKSREKVRVLLQRTCPKFDFTFIILNYTTNDVDIEGKVCVDEF